MFYGSDIVFWCCIFFTKNNSNNFKYTFWKQVKIDSFFSIKSVCKIFTGLFLIFLFSSYFLNAIENSKQAYDRFYGPKAAENYESEIYDEEKLRIFIVPALHMNFIKTGLILVNYGISDAICKAYNI